LLLTGLPINEAMIHLKTLQLLWKFHVWSGSIMCRQLAMKTWSSSSWLIHAWKLLPRYDRHAMIHTLIELCPSKSCWRWQTVTAVHRLWENKIDTQVSYWKCCIRIHTVLVTHIWLSTVSRHQC
jgi:hypothetical protein